MNLLYPFEQAIVQHGAETLAGFKPASLLCWEADEGEIEKILAYGTREYQRFDVHFCLLGKCGNAHRILIYRAHLLTKWILRPDVSHALHNLGYRYANENPPVQTTAKTSAAGTAMKKEEFLTYLLFQLRERICLSPTLPDEIGLFLGYPVKDVLRFMEDHGQSAYPLRGSWRVYHHPKKAEATFHAFRACRQCWLHALQEGSSLPQVMNRLCPAM